MCLRSRCCSGSFALIQTLRGVPGRASVQRRRCGHRSQVAASNNTVVPSRTGIVWPAGQVMVRARKSSLKSLLAKKAPFWVCQGLQKMVPRLATTSSTIGLLMYPRSM